jgi:hypothetical protein
MQMVPFWWMALSSREKLGIPAAAAITMTFLILIAFLPKPPQEICNKAEGALLESNDDIAKATSSPQEERCSAYQQRVALLTKISHEWSYCVVHRRGDERGMNVAAELNFYSQLVDTKCKE